MTVSRESVSRVELPVSVRYYITDVSSLNAKAGVNEGHTTIPYALHLELP